MPRNMSFSLTTDQVRNKQKTVTRRFEDFIRMFVKKYNVPRDVILTRIEFEYI